MTHPFDKQAQTGQEIAKSRYGESKPHSPKPVPSTDSADPAKKGK